MGGRRQGLPAEEDGHTFVIAAGDKYGELAKNSLDEMSLASPALAPNALFMRTQSRLYRISASVTSAAALPSWATPALDAGQLSSTADRRSVTLCTS